MSSTTATLTVQVRYVSANERLIAELERKLEYLTRSGRPFILTIASDGERLALWDGQKAGMF